MSYCNGLCKDLDEKRHRCKATGEGLTYMRFGSRSFGYTVHEHRGFCKEDEKEIVKNEIHNRPSAVAERV